MKNFSKLLILFLFLVCIVPYLSADTDFYNTSKIRKIEITFTEADWDFRMDTAKHGEDGYLMAEKVIFEGVEFDSVGVKYKGNSSYDSTYKKNPFRITLDEFKDQDYEGFKDFKFANCFDDPSMLRDVLAYGILGKYMDCPRANYAEIYVNGEFIGLYSNTETINKPFCASRFGSSKNSFFECTPVVLPSPQSKSNLKYLSDDSTDYFDYYDMKSKTGWYDLIKLCQVLGEKSENVEEILDMDRAIWMVAFDNALLNLDSYIGVFSQNFYLYKDDNGRFLPIIWDLNMSFGGFPFLGNGNMSMGAITSADLPKLTLTPHMNDAYWPLLNLIFNNDRYRKQYFAHLRTIYSENFADNQYLETASDLQELIGESVSKDENKFFSDSEFAEGLTKSVNVGSYEVPGIMNLMNSRRGFLSNEVEFNLEPPSVITIQLSDTKPPLNSEVGVTAYLSNANYARLAYRFDKSDRFTYSEMYDDGEHNDGSAEDGIYGGSFVMADTMVQYYFYMENMKAGLFVPARAEKEFLTLRTDAVGISDSEYNFGLKQNYPNPVSKTTTISFSIENNSQVSLQLFDVLGEEIRVIFEGAMQPGEYSLAFEPGKLPGGIYFYRLSDGRQSITRRMIIAD